MKVVTKGNTEDDSVDSDYLHGDASSEDPSTHSTEERDEVKEVMKMSQKDTRRVIFWRFVVTFMLLLTALAVTGTTYKFLADEQGEDMEAAVSKVASCLSRFAFYALTTVSLTI